MVLVEPIYELANSEAQSRMRTDGYVRGLTDAVEHLGANVADYRLLDYSVNTLNPSGLVLIEKESNDAGWGEPTWRCPITHTPVSDLGVVFAATQSGLVYPVLRGVLMLRE